MADFIASLDTTVPVVRTIAQIHALVERFGAHEWTVIYERGIPSGVRFAVVDPNVTEGQSVPLFVELRAPSDRIAAELKAPRGKRRWLTTAQREKAEQQAQRVAWRQLHDFVRASLIAVQSGIMSLGEAFLANVLIRDGDGASRRVVEVMQSQRLLQPVNRAALPPVPP